MLAALLLAGATPQTAVEAERAFAADAKRIGEWRALRKWAADDATMFVPHPTPAKEYSKPPIEPVKVVDWWPIATFVSCDSNIAVNIGGATWPDGHGSFVWTVWERKGGKWRWTFNHRQDVPVRRPRPATPEVWRAVCDAKPDDVLFVAHRRMPRFHHQAMSPDRTLHYHIDWDGEYPSSSVTSPSLMAFYPRLSVSLWDGSGWKSVSDDRFQLRAMF